MFPRLVLIGQQYVDPTKVIAILRATLAHTALVDGITARSVLVLERATQPYVVTSASPTSAAAKIAAALSPES